MNSIQILEVYRYAGTWAFTDKARGLINEPFVCGVPEIIDAVLEACDITGASFRLLLSDSPFPNFAASLDRMYYEDGGVWYNWAVGGKRGWLCPSLFKYFDTAPARLYVKPEALL